MQRFLSIGLITILLLNTGGFYVILISLQYHHDLTLGQELDVDHYDTGHTVTLKLAVAIPYMADQPDFERVDDVIVHQGEHYRLIKQRFAHDTLTMICMRDTARQKIHERMTDYVKSFADKACGHSHTKPGISFLKDYLPHHTAIACMSSGWESAISHPDIPDMLMPSFGPSVIHPPQNEAGSN